MRKLLTILAAMSLTGCIYQAINAQDIADATKICEKHGHKVVEIAAHALGIEYVICSNRKAYKLVVENL